MAFNFGVLSPTYTWPVAVSIPDAGKRRTETFTATFNRLSKDENKQLAELMMAYQRAMEANESVSDLPDDREIADRVLAGWKGILDGDGEEMPCTEGNREQLLNVAAFVSAVVRAYFESIEPAKSKN
jgi:hypothetical protein